MIRPLKPLVFNFFVFIFSVTNANGAADLAILNQNETFNYFNETNYLIIQAQGGPVKNVRVAVIEFKTEDGQYLPTDTIQWIGTPSDMTANSIQKLGFTLNG